MTTALTILCLASGALFDVQSVPLPAPHAEIFLMRADSDATADLCVLTGQTLSIHFLASDEAPHTIVFPEGASAFDVFDTDRDGRREVVAVCPGRIVSYPIVPGQYGGSPEALFSFEVGTMVSAPQPYPHVLMVPFEDGHALALPSESELVLYQLDGTVATRYPARGGTPDAEDGEGASFWDTPVTPPAIGPPDALELSVQGRWRPVYDAPKLEQEGETPEVSGRRGTLAQAREAATQEHASWLWFPIRTSGEDDLRALYALPGGQETQIRVYAQETGKSGGEGTFEVGPVRRYPGTLLVPLYDLPDFNGDGYTDLFLWKSPEPGMSVNALTRAATMRSWPVSLTAHLYMPGKRRYEPKPSAHIAAQAPVAWFVRAEAGVPVRNMVFRDFDGDGRTDWGCSLGPKSFSAWLYRDGFGDEPDFETEFDEPIRAVAFRANLKLSGRTSVGLLTDSAVHVLIPSTSAGGR